MLTWAEAVVVFPLGRYRLRVLILNQLNCFRRQLPMRVTIHAAILVPTTVQQIEQIGQREGWRVLTRLQGDGAFRLVEFWLENRILFEFLPPEFETEYLQITQPDMVE